MQPSAAQRSVLLAHKPYPRILHHGAVDGVTGSCHQLLIAPDSSVLVDCGLFQGAELSRQGAAQTSLEIDFPVETVRALLITHCHIDHVGRIPYLLAAGFDGPIYCSEPTAELLPLVLEDAVQIGFTRDRRLVERFVDLIRKRIVPVPYKQWIEVALPAARLKVRFKPAGHILGSAYIECETDIDGSRRRVVFSGDLGAPYSPLLAAPEPPYSADVLVLESTYGDREHEDRRQRRQRLRRIIERCFHNRGVVLIPAFSIGRTQELLYELEGIIHQVGAGWAGTEIIVDSPLAARFTDTYRSLWPFWDAEARHRKATGRHPLSFEQLTTIESHQDHLNAVSYLKKSARPCIVLAASGMCSGGRIVNYLKALIEDPRTDILFVGYQAQGTAGRTIQKYGPKRGYVELDGKRYQIAAAVHTLSGYSAHADQKNLLNFVRRMRKKPEEIRLVHGDREAKRTLQRVLQETVPEAEVIVP